MTIVKQIKKKLYQYSDDDIISFKELRLQLDNTIKVDSFRRALHRLHKQGVITINNRGSFVKAKEFKVYLFVYGSLKKGFENNDMLSQANYISKAKTVNKFAMYKEIDKEYPYIIKDASLGQNIDGELYEITRKDVLEQIDTFEGAPDYFKQTSIMIITRRQKLKAKTYVLATPRVPLHAKPLKIWKKHPIKLNIDFDAYYKSILN